MLSPAPRSPDVIASISSPATTPRSARKAEPLETLSKGTALALRKAREHVVDAGLDAAENLRGVWDSVAASPILLGSPYDIVQEVIVHLTGEALAFEVEGGNARVLGV